MKEFEIVYILDCKEEIEYIIAEDKEEAIRRLKLRNKNRGIEITEIEET